MAKTWTCSYPSSFDLHLQWLRSAFLVLAFEFMPVDSFKAVTSLCWSLSLNSHRRLIHLQCSHFLNWFFSAFGKTHTFPMRFWKRILPRICSPGTGWLVRLWTRMSGDLSQGPRGGGVRGPSAPTSHSVPVLPTALRGPRRGTPVCQIHPEDLPAFSRISPHVYPRASLYNPAHTQAPPFSHSHFWAQSVPTTRLV